MVFNKSQEPSNNASVIIDNANGLMPIFQEIGVLVVIAGIYFYFDISNLIIIAIGLAYAIGRILYDYFWKRNQINIKQFSVSSIKSITYNIEEERKSFGYFKVVFAIGKSRTKTKVIKMKPFEERPKHDIEAARALFKSIGFLEKY